METFSFNQEAQETPQKSKVKRPDDIAKPGRRNFLKGLLGVGALAIVQSVCIEITTRLCLFEEKKKATINVAGFLKWKH